MAGEAAWHLLGIWASWYFLRGPQVFRQLHLISVPSPGAGAGGTGGSGEVYLAYLDFFSG